MLALAITFPALPMTAFAELTGLLTAGEYFYFGTMDNPIYIDGDVTLVLDNAEIKNETTDTSKYSAAISVLSGNAMLILKGENKVEGCPGYAGIYVAKGATLTIKGTGSLEAKGGAGASINNVSNGTITANIICGGGAGIGGNGICYYSVNRTATLFADDRTTSFGTIEIKEGKVTATGGEANQKFNTPGGGAGIGGGGNSVKSDFENITSGKVIISGGTVIALGGDQNNNDNYWTFGGAGIGTGGSYIEGSGDSPESDVTVKISGGTIEATGRGDGAGIGGGANVNGGKIYISGGKVNATGGYERKPNGTWNGGFGGAGIGGGDEQSVYLIEIGGDAKVVARAIGAAAGIGTGMNGCTVTNDECSVRIYGNADVTAYGGSHVTRPEGGAGIGTGRQPYSKVPGFEDISIEDTATVRAFAGPNAQAIGVGCGAGIDDWYSYSVNFSQTATVWMITQNGDSAKFYYEPFWGLDAEDKTKLDTDYVTANGAKLVWYLKGVQDSGKVAGANKSAASLTWEYGTDGILSVLNENETTVARIKPSDYAYTGFSGTQSWAAVLPSQEVTLTYKLSDDDEDPTKVTCMAEVETTLADAPTMSGKIFTGWKCSADNEIYDAGAAFTPTADTEFVAQWKDKSSGGGGSSSHYSLPEKSEDKTKPETEPETKTEASIEELFNTAEHKAYVFGYEDGMVHPEDNITRAEATVIFYRLLTDAARTKYAAYINDFTDVNIADWFNDGVSTMSNGSFVNGYPDGTFRPNDAITRAEMATLISNFDNLYEMAANTFFDVSGHWAEKYISLAVAKGWMSGYPDGTFRPDQPITRAETMSMINRMLGRSVDAYGLHIDAKQWMDNTEDKWYYYTVLEATNSHDYERVAGAEIWTVIRYNR